MKRLLQSEKCGRGAGTRCEQSIPMAMKTLGEGSP